MDCPTLEKIIISSLDGLTWFYLDVIGNTTYNMKGICIRFVNGIWPLDLKEHFRKRFCQMLKLLTNSVQKLQLQVLELSYINILYIYYDTQKFDVWGKGESEANIQFRAYIVISTNKCSPCIIHTGILCS